MTNKFINLIEAGRQDDAIRAILEQDTLAEQLSALEQLIDKSSDVLLLRLELSVATELINILDFTRSLDHARALEFCRTLSLSLARILDIVRALTQNLNLNRALDLSRARALDLAKALEHGLDLAPVRVLAVSLDRARSLVLDAEQDMLYFQKCLIIADSIVYILTVGFTPHTIYERLITRYAQSLANACDECLRLPQTPVLDTITKVLNQIIGDDLRHMTLEGEMTPDHLENQIIPYIRALYEIQCILSHTTDYPEPTIVQMNGAKIEVLGLADAIRAVHQGGEGIERFGLSDGEVLRLTEIIKGMGDLKLRIGWGG